MTAPPEADSGLEEQLPGALLQASTYTHPVESIRLIETHMSWVALTGDYAYKVKKPVCFDFVDFSSASRREWFCQEELRLNRAFAPELYLAVVPLVLREDGTLLVDPQDRSQGEVIEWAVKMRQFDVAAQADRLVETGAATVAQLFRFGELLAGQHAALAPASSAADIADAIVGNFRTLESLSSAAPLCDRLANLKTSAVGQLEQHEHLLDRRRREGFVRECHGDLHLSNMVALDDQLRAFDCLEFDRELREIDVWNDVAFLVMDCALRGREDLAYAFVDGYLDTSADYDGLELLPMFTCYRSMVRAKVAALTAEQSIPKKSAEQAGSVKQSQALAKLLAHVDWAEQQYARPAGRLLITCGLSGSGKSYWAQQLVPALGAIRLRSDLLRKHQHGLQSLASSNSGVAEGLYSASNSDSLYLSLARLAVALVLQGEDVIVDAACLQQHQRAVLIQAADAAGAPWLLLHLYADEAELRRRIRQRARAGNDPSEADDAVLDWQLQNQELPAAEEQPLQLDTGALTLADCVAQIELRFAR